MEDKHGFLDNVTNWNNHRPLLLKALQATDGDVLELGMGDGSTPFLHAYCEEYDRKLESYDNNEEWAGKFRHMSTLGHWVIDVKDNFENKVLFKKEWGVAFVDNAPGETRWELIKFLKDRAKIIVIHDTEPAATGYMLDKIWGLFKYRVDYQSNGAWASAVSNDIDITQWVGDYYHLTNGKWECFTPGNPQPPEAPAFTISKFTMRRNKTVILSSNDNPDYLKYYPYVAWAWNQLGWDTLLFYLGKHSALLDEYKALNGRFDTERNKIIALSNFEGYRPETIVQCSRLFGGMVYSDDRMLMTGDIDMIPLSDYWQPVPEHINVYGHDLTDYTQFPICYIAMTSSKWRYVMGCPDKTTLEHEIKFMLDRSPNAKSEDFEKWWSYDQQYITEKLLAIGVGNNVLRGKDGILAQGRADRYDWEGTKDKGTIDAHMPRPFNIEAVKYILQKNFDKLPEWIQP